MATLADFLTKLKAYQGRDIFLDIFVHFLSSQVPIFSHTDPKHFFFFRISSYVVVDDQ